MRLVCLPIGSETIMKASRKASTKSTELQRKRSVEVVNFIRFFWLTNNFRFCCGTQVSRATDTHCSFVWRWLVVVLQIWIMRWAVCNSYFCFYKPRTALEFFLNGAELSLNSVNSGNSGNLINHWSMNWAQFKDPIFHMCLAGTLVASWSLKCFVIEFAEFSENI